MGDGCSTKGTGALPQAGNGTRRESGLYLAHNANGLVRQGRSIT